VHRGDINPAVFAPIARNTEPRSLSSFRGSNSSASRKSGPRMHPLPALASTLRGACLSDHRAPSDEPTRLPLGRMIILGSFVAGWIETAEGDVSVAGEAVGAEGDGAAVALLARPLGDTSFSIAFLSSMSVEKTVPSSRISTCGVVPRIPMVATGVSIFISPVFATLPAIKVKVPLVRLIRTEFDEPFGS
jgi:hypothetical protein